MPEITIELIRKRAEHNEGLIHTLEELTLHQEELESINETLGCNCRRLKILYLQNNIIGEMKNLHHMKELEYLNLALNNITKVQGLHACEFLNKLDLTVNFVDLDELESSITAMEGNLHLRDLYMMGNPCQQWKGFASYVIARLPQLERLDGKKITRTDRILAQQRLPYLRQDIAPLAEEVQRRKRQEKLEEGEKDTVGSPKSPSRSHKAEGSTVHDRHIDINSTSSIFSSAAMEGDSKGDYDITASTSAPGKEGVDEAGGDGEKEELTKHTPEVRTAIYREMAEQKKEKDDRQKENLPKERDFGREQEDAITCARERESEGIIRQCNEGKLAFRFDETPSSVSGLQVEGDRPRRGGREAVIVLEVSVPRYLDSSLIDVDVHPHYVSIVIKGKVLRLSLQTEVRASEAKARRSKTTGSLVITMPKVDPDQSLGLLSASARRAPRIVADRAAASKNAKANDAGRSKPRGRGTPTLAQLMMQEAKAAAADTSRDGKPGETKSGASHQAVSIRGMVGPRHGGLAEEDDECTRFFEVTSTKRTANSTAEANGNTSVSRLDSSKMPIPAPKNTVTPERESGLINVIRPPTPPPADHSACHDIMRGSEKDVAQDADWCRLDDVD